jgi:hypothetical protein
MTARRWAAAAGAAVGLVYVMTAALSGRLNPMDRRPLLDGIAPPPAYRWVKPPPSLASGNQKPESGRFEVPLDPQAGSEAQVLSTKDAQMSIVLGEGSIPPQPGFSAVAVTITPLAPMATGAGDSRLIAGNVYRIQARYAPNGPPVTAVGTGAQLVLFYPPPLDNKIHDHVLVFSTDAVMWKPLQSTDSSFQQQVLADISQFGYFAVATTGTATKAGFPIGKVVYLSLIIGVVVVLAVGIIVSELRRRRTRNERSWRS